MRGCGPSTGTTDGHDLTGAEPDRDHPRDIGIVEFQGRLAPDEERGEGVLEVEGDGPKDGLETPIDLCPELGGDALEPGTSPGEVIELAADGGEAGGVTVELVDGQLVDRAKL